MIVSCQIGELVNRFALAPYVRSAPVAAAKVRSNSVQAFSRTSRGPGIGHKR